MRSLIRILNQIFEAIGITSQLQARSFKEDGKSKVGVFQLVESDKENTGEVENILLLVLEWGGRNSILAIDKDGSRTLVGSGMSDASAYAKLVVRLIIEIKLKAVLDQF